MDIKSDGSSIVVAGSNLQERIYGYIFFTFHLPVNNNNNNNNNDEMKIDNGNEEKSVYMLKEYHKSIKTSGSTYGTIDCIKFLTDNSSKFFFFF